MRAASATSTTLRPAYRSHVTPAAAADELLSGEHVEASRLAQIAWEALRAVAGLALDLLVVRDRSPAQLAAARLRVSFQRLGPTFVKLGQLVSASPGTFPQVLVEEMASCQDEVPPEPWDAAGATLDEQLGELRARIEWIAWRPIAAASIAGVYPAMLVSGEQVVVKIQRRDLVGTLRQDLRILLGAARWATRLVRSLASANPVGVIEDFAHSLADELDFGVEAAHMDRIRELLSVWPVRIPAVHHELTTAKVLTMERLEGVKVSETAELRRRGVDLPRLADTVLGALLTTALGHGVFHGDGHAGNMLVAEDGALVLLDFGIVGHLDERTRATMEGLLAAFVTRRFRKVAEAIVALAGAPEVDIEAAVADLEAISAEYLDRPWGEVPVARMLQDLFRSANRHGIVVPTDLVLLFKQILYLDGLGRSLNPSFDVFADGARFLPLLGAGEARAT